MKQPASVALATWMLDHLTSWPHGEALAGDLLEEFHAGRSIAWYWQQAVCAVAITLLERTRNYTLPLVFSTAWTVLYPAWQLGLWRSRLAQSLFDRCSALQWPYSASLELSRGILPAATFIWFGLLFYLLLRNTRPSVFRLLGSLSLSLNILLLSIIGFVGRFGPSAAHTNPLSDVSTPYHLALSIALPLSLFSAILCALPPRQKRSNAAYS